MTNVSIHSRRWLWLSIAALVLPAVALWLVHAWLGWEGERLWSQAQARLKAEGETLDFMAIVPKPVPDEDNFFAIEPLKDIALVIDGDRDKGKPAEKRKQLETLCFVEGTSNPNRPWDHCVAYGVKWNAEAWASYYRVSGKLPMPSQPGNAGRDVLVALKATDGLLAELHHGLDRQHSLITPAWERRELPKLLAAIPMTHFSACQNLTRVIALRSQSGVSCGETHQSTNDVRVLLRLVEGMGREPTLINGVLATGMAGVTMDNVWSLLETRSMGVSDLLALERDLVRLDISSVMATALHGEMAVFANSIDTFGEPLSHADPAYLIHHAKSTGQLREGIKMPLLIGLWHLNPRAVTDGNKGRGIDVFLDCQLLPLRDAGLRGLAEGGIRFGKYEDEWKMNSNVMSMLMNVALPSLSSIGGKAFRLEALNRQARLACALERYFLQYQRYPEALNELVPAFIDKVLLDPSDDKPMRYARTPTGRYKLWSLGFDGDDDGGKVIASPKDAPSQPRLDLRDYPGDWVWSYERLVPMEEK